MEKCQVKHCRQYPVIGYYDKDVCQKHWSKHCNEKDNFDLKKEFDIKENPIKEN
jgi:hypothetical protein